MAETRRRIRPFLSASSKFSIAVLQTLDVRSRGRRHETIVALRTWDKHFLIELVGFSIRIHLLMFGSYSINERKDKPVRLGLAFTRGRELNFYTCAVRYIEGALDDGFNGIRRKILFINKN